jgi:hypothetical protein
MTRSRRAAPTASLLFCATWEDAVPAGEQDRNRAQCGGEWPVGAVS